jgi:RNA polymerase sigma-32 factor
MGMKTKKAKATAPSKKKSTPRVSGRTSDKAVVKYDPLQRYLSEISRYNLLTREEEVSLGKLVQEQGDQDAAYRLVTSNLRLGRENCAGIPAGMDAKSVGSDSRGKYRAYAGG